MNRALKETMICREGPRNGRVSQLIAGVDGQGKLFVACVGVELDVQRKDEV